MGREFIPTLIQTTTGEPYYWESLKSLLRECFHGLARKNDIEAIYNAIKNWSEDFRENEKETKDRIGNFLADVSGASGIVAVTNELYQRVILAILNEFSV